MTRPPDDHHFGSLHTEVKLQVLADYLPAYTTALKNQRWRLHYIDAFAGTGTCRIKTPSGERVIKGSARVALDCEPAFHRFHFIEQRARAAASLQALADANPDRDIRVVRGDANHALPDTLATLDAQHDRAMTFLDPYGMSVTWSTLEAVNRCVTDLWYLFPLSGLYRQAASASTALDADKSASIDRLLGTHDWYDAFYRGAPQDDLFAGVPEHDVRSADVQRIVRYVSARLAKLFGSAALVGPKVLHQSGLSGRPGAPLFALYFATTNKSPAAITLATRFARHVIKQH